MGGVGVLRFENMGVEDEGNDSEFNVNSGWNKHVCICGRLFFIVEIIEIARYSLVPNKRKDSPLVY